VVRALSKSHLSSGLDQRETVSAERIVPGWANSVEHRTNRSLACTRPLTGQALPGPPVSIADRPKARRGSAESTRIFSRAVAHEPRPLNRSDPMSVFELGCTGDDVTTISMGHALHE
jgi:hypothetical protein